MRPPRSALSDALLERGDAASARQGRWSRPVAGGEEAAVPVGAARTVPPATYLYWFRLLTVLVAGTISGKRGGNG